MSTCSLTILLSGLSYSVGLWESGDEGAGGEPETTAIWLSRSVALRLEPGAARAFRLAVEVVMEGSVALDRRSPGRRPPLDRDESRLCMLAPLRASVGGDAISSSESEYWVKRAGM